MDNPGFAPICRDMEQTLDVIIAGGGLNGCSLALALSQAGVSVAIIDPFVSTIRADADFDGRGYALAHGSKRLLSAIGIWGQVQDHAQPILEIKVTDGRAGEGPSPFVLEFDHNEIDEGPMGFMIEDRYLRKALLTALSGDQNIAEIYDTSVTSQEISESNVAVTLSSGKTLRAKVLIGADGQHSPTAKRAGLKHIGWSYAQTALVCAVRHAMPHHGIAHQFFMPSGPLAILPLPGQESSIVWTESNSEAARVNALDDANYLSELLPRFGEFLGDISLVGARFTYPLSLSLAQSFVTSRVALLGDAAHKVHPLAGQGLNAGLKDVGALAEVLALAHRRGEDIGRPDVLERYQQWRSFDCTSLALATDSFNRLFSNDNSLVRLGRNFGMGLINALPRVRRSLIREAAGLNGDLPKLLQGRAI